jgi:hypothetical protein
MLYDADGSSRLCRIGIVNGTRQRLPFDYVLGSIGQSLVRHGVATMRRPQPRWTDSFFVFFFVLEKRCSDAKACSTRNNRSAPLSGRRAIVFAVRGCGMDGRRGGEQRGPGNFCFKTIVNSIPRVLITTSFH